MGFSGGGKGNSSSETKQTAINQQVATNGSGTSVGGSGNVVAIQNTDIDAVKASLNSSAEVTNAALSSGLTATHDAIGAVSGNANLAISANTDLAKSFGSDLVSVNNQNIGLLQSVSDSLTGVELANQKVASAALGGALQIAQNAAPQTSAAQNEQVSGTIASAIKFALIAAAIVGTAYALK